MHTLPPTRRWLLGLALAAALAGYLGTRSERVAPVASDTPRTLAPTLAAAPAAAPATPALASGSAANPTVRRALFRYVEPANAPALTAALPAPARAVHYVRIDAALVAGKASPFWQKPGEGRVRVPLPDGSALTIAIDASEMLGANRFASTGTIEGRPLSLAVFSFNDGFLTAAIEDPLLGRFALRTATDELAQFYRIDPALVAGCGGELRPDKALLAAAAQQARASGSLSSNPFAPETAAASPDNPQHAEVHVLMAYTQAVKADVPGLSPAARTASLLSEFDNAVARTNAAFDRSLVTARLRLVRAVETTLANDEQPSPAPNWQKDALEALQRTNDGKMDELHALRDAIGADIVCLAVNRRDTLSSGLSYLLDKPGHLGNPVFAFSVVRYGEVAGTNVVPHEFGHVFGCAHDFATAQKETPPSSGAYRYSYGYRFLGADGRFYHDIMSYDGGFADVELSYFSTPKITLPAPINRALGIAEGQPGEADAARTIEQLAFLTSGFRLQTQAVANAGTLINVATRAFVGNGDLPPNAVPIAERVLIGGFVVQGPAGSSKRMLIRAAGPALTGFGLPGALNDPVLRIFSGSTEVFQNDNWGTAANAPDIANATTQAGAFGFAAGSRDAAVLATLAPGAYTANVSGANGATGFALIEAYQADAGPSRIVNLSTLGYADNVGKEMLGGFVVQGAPGSTKRILIRVLGPTLGVAPFNIPNSLFDPFMELRGATGDLLVLNDDWSSGSEIVGGEFDDFKPLVQIYGEQKIAATGFAPKNRREPCILVDLPPGNYTVIVKPFELRDSDPELDQPARPGVGIVEVYEINP